MRRAFLCGEDSHTCQSYEHRRAWIEERLLFQGQVFALDICAYAVMSNHHHVVLHADKAQAEDWSELEVIERWHRLFAGHPLSQRLLAGDKLLEAERKLVSELAALWRSRLTDISWFMRCLNESIARRANEEANCSGRFWEGRFKSQALLDEKALAACMAYVDLNPVAIAGELPPILERLQIDPRYWLYITLRFESRFKGLVGTAFKLKAACETLGYRRTPNLAACKELLT